MRAFAVRALLVTAVGCVEVKNFRSVLPVEGAAETALTPRVILVTLDGVRREEFYDAAVFPKLHARTDGAASALEVATPTLLSLPAYQSIFTGRVTECANNDCAPAQDETFPERLVRELKLEPAQVAVFASWAPIARAVARDVQAIHLDVGPHEGEGAAPPWGRARYDEVTWSKATAYLEDQKPRFLFLSFDDADEWGHRKQRDEYLSALKRYDGWLDELLTREKDAVVIVTTDHGRGAGNEWTEHGAEYPAAKGIWVWSRGLPKRAPLRHHLDVRPAIEAVFGLSP